MWYLVAGALIATYLLTTFVLGEVFSSYVATYVAQPLLWIGVAILVLRLPGERPAGRFSLRGPLIAVGAMAAVLQVVLWVTAGFLSGFGNSPYAHSPSGIATNMVYVGSALVGIELSRAYLVNSLSRKRATLVIGVVAIFLVVLSIPRSQWMTIGGGQETVSFLGETWLPLLAGNLLACFLAYLGGPLPAIAYMGVLAAFEWLSPVLPDLTPMMTALFGTIGPVLGFALIQYGLLPQAFVRRQRPRARKETPSGLPIAWTAAGFVSVALIWFSLGLFSVWPTVIYSGSMSPAIEVGDVVIVVETTPEEISIGDVIAYRSGEDTVVHRVVDIADGEGGTAFITQGDANSNADSEPVLSDQVLGRVVFRLPKVGWASVGVKDWLFSPT